MYEGVFFSASEYNTYLQNGHEIIPYGPALVIFNVEYFVHFSFPPQNGSHFSFRNEREVLFREAQEVPPLPPNPQYLTFSVLLERVDFELLLQIQQEILFSGEFFRLLSRDSAYSWWLNKRTANEIRYPSLKIYEIYFGVKPGLYSLEEFERFLQKKDFFLRQEYRRKFQAPDGKIYLRANLR